MALEDAGVIHDLVTGHPRFHLAPPGFNVITEQHFPGFFGHQPALEFSEFVFVCAVWKPLGKLEHAVFDLGDDQVQLVPQSFLAHSVD